MLRQFQLIRNIGLFDSVTGTTETQLAKLTLIYAENGRGKTTLCSILRSLSSGNSAPINERKRLGAQYPPHVVLNCSDGTQPVIFQNNRWTIINPNLCIFDDVFVDQNVYSGLVVTPNHRHNLHELIIGAQGVALARTIDDLASQISKHSTELRIKGNAIPLTARGQLSVDSFCELKDRPEIDTAIQTAERRIAALKNAQLVRDTPSFENFALPSIDIVAIKSLLARGLSDLDMDAVTKVRDHFSQIGESGEQWIADGMNLIPAHQVLSQPELCPFCRQSLDDSPMINHYRAYFSRAYTDLKRDVTSHLSYVNRVFGGDALAAFQRALKVTESRRLFWASLCAIPELNIDTEILAQIWQEARAVLVVALESKRDAPLECFSFNENEVAKIQTFQSVTDDIARISTDFQNINSIIAKIKTDTAVGNLTVAVCELENLKATKERFSLTIAPLCDAYMQVKAQKAVAEEQKSVVRQQLDVHRAKVFPAYQNAINGYLSGFNVGFKIEGIAPVNPVGRPSSTYHIVINNSPIRLAAGDDVEVAAFKNTLSAGDRNSLALAFFFASLARDPNLASRVVVIDDPVSSLDDHREFTTVQTIRRLAQHVEQVIVFSHDKRFLCRIWEHAEKQNTATLQITRAVTGSTITTWNAHEDSFTEYDHRHEVLRNYRDANAGNQREVAQSIRPVLEGFLRIACPEHFPSGRLLGQFIDIVRQNLARNIVIISPDDLQELANLTEYANKFHHDMNPMWETEAINETELLGFVRRTLEFTKKR